MSGLYLDPGHLMDYQVTDTARAVALRSAVLGWDPGMGKSRGLLALACRLMDDGVIDAVLLVCEQNKLDEWHRDIATLTAATHLRHHGSARLEALANAGMPQILLTTYETAKIDALSEDGGDGPLTRAVLGRRVLVAYDEMPKLAEASSGLYRAHCHLLSRLPEVRVIGLTATPYTRDWDSVYNMFLMICPQVLPSREEFERHCVLRREPRGKTVFIEHNIETMLLQAIRPYLLRRRKTDPAVARLFPRMLELVVHTAMGDLQSQGYEILAEYGVQEADAGREVPGLWNVLRMMAAYPEALMGADGRLAARIVRQFGEQTLTAMRPGKLDHLQALAGRAVAEGHKTLIFSFFGPTVLPLLARDLAPLGVPVLLYYGEMGVSARAKALQAFREHEGPAVLLSSDAGSRGINVPEATRLIEYECALTFGVSAQRRNRIHRLDSPHPEVRCASLVALDTVEEAVAHVMLRRNGETDRTLGDDVVRSPGFTSADQRRAMMRRRVAVAA